MEGTRPLLVEVQALVAPTEIVPPRRIATGIDRNRLALVLAVLARHGGLSLAAADVFVNVAGGVRVDEPGADLAVALALASAHRGEPLADADGKPLACFGEVGLTGELRYVAHADRRVAEARQVRPRPGARPRPATSAIEGLAAALARRCVEARPNGARARADRSRAELPRPRQIRDRTRPPIAPLDKRVFRPLHTEFAAERGSMHAVCHHGAMASARPGTI